MLDIISKLLIFITTVGTFTGLYFKGVSGFFYELIKSKFKNVPEENSVFQIVIKIGMFVIVILDIVYLFLLIYSSYLNKNTLISSFSTVNSNIFTIIISVLTLFVIFWTCNFLVELHGLYLQRLKNNYVYLKKYKKSINNFSLTISSILLTVFGLTTFFNICTSFSITDLINKNIDISNMNTLMQLFAVTIFFSIIVILNLKMNEVSEILINETTFKLITDKDTILCSCFLEFKEFYLIIKDNKEKYIKKSSVKEIEKLLEEVAMEEMIKKEETKTVEIKSKKFSNYLSKIKGNKIYIIITIFIAFSFMFPMFLWIIYKPPYADWYGILASFIGGSIGGITTLIALYISTKETRKIQNENIENSNKLLKLQILNEKINENIKFRLFLDELAWNILWFPEEITSHEIDTKVKKNHDISHNLKVTSNCFNDSAMNDKLINVLRTCSNIIMLIAGKNKLMIDIDSNIPVKEHILKLNDSIDEIRKEIDCTISELSKEKDNVASK